MDFSESEAKTKRTSIKAATTRLKTYIESRQSEHAKKFELAERKRKLANLFEQYDQVQTRIECLTPDTDSKATADHVEDRTRFEESYFQIMSVYDERISTLEQQYVMPQVNANIRDQSEPQNNSESHIRLPKIQLPSFSGSYDEWYTFHDSFEKLIHANERLSAIQKFHYLRSSLKDKAAEVIKFFDITTDNYEEAWQLLNERFDNKRSIVQTHVKAMFETAPIQKENGIALRSLLDNIIKHFRALKALQRPVDNWDDIMIYLTLTKLDPITVKEWETNRTDTNIPTFKQLTEFLSKRCQALETISNRSIRVGSDTSNSSQRVKHPSTHVTTSNQSCIHCKNKHFIFQCESFRKLPVERRFEIVKNAHLCINCLRSGSHQAKNCTAGSCRKCGKAHNTLIHFETSKADTTKGDSQKEVANPVDISLTNVSSPIVTQCSQVNDASKIFLSTAIVNVYDHKGQPHGCRVLLDSGSQLNFITEEFADKLEISTRDLRMSITGVAEGTFESKKMINIKFQSLVNTYKNEIECIVLPRITQRLPQEFCHVSEFKIPSNIVLADPNFNIPSDIDILIGAQIFWQLICVGQIRQCKEHPTLQKTKLGWVISGRSLKSSDKNTAAACHLSAIDKLNKSLSKFWEVEHEIPCEGMRLYAPDERICETHFQQNVRRTDEGRFIVKLPINHEKFQQLGDTKEIARNRFINLERRLVKQPLVYAQYKNFMREYISLKHMQEVKDIETNGKTTQYYLPHHAVCKESSVTTKLRVVFDASCKGTTGVSLNDTLLVGPTIQQDLFSILTRFRTFRYAMTADVTKMYRQILIDKSQRSLQRIFWRESPQDELRTFELLTVTYGTASASFLAIRAIRKLAEDEAGSLPLGSSITLRDFYVDDLLSGASTIQEAIEIKNQTIGLLRKGGFELAKWSSNHASLQGTDGTRKKELELVIDHNETRALGVIWNCESDAFKFVNIGHLPPLERPTKRSILSRIALVFDPLGWLGPSVIIAKLIMQDLWRTKIEWDESISNDLHTLWKEYECKLQTLSNIEITRNVIAFSENRGIEIHGFSDASQQAYGACVYVRSISEDGQFDSCLLCSKSRVAPLKSLSIPRLELCGALLLAQLVKKVLSSLPFTVDSIHMWTDSRIVLCWLQNCSRQWTPFVANRVAEIQQLTCVQDWKHVPSQENPADPLSRGIMPDLLIKSELWWYGPPWLKLSKNEWPLGEFHVSDNELPEKRATSLKADVKVEQDIFNRFSRLSRLIRVVAFCNRFITNCKVKKSSGCHANNKKSVRSLSVEELEQSKVILIKLVQRDHFTTELRLLENNKPIGKNSNILSLNPFIDANGILRVGGRLRYANVSYNCKHPILLPSKHAFTRLIIVHEHQRHLHAGAQATLMAVRQNYWPISARSMVRNLIKKCIVCVRSDPKLNATLMADLPETRVNAVRYAFQRCGVDYAGPLSYKEGRRKSAKTMKCYIALFVCLATKAVHIELASDLSTETFLNVFKRFISRRGRPTDIYSDNGLNFVGAKRELDELYKLLDVSFEQKIVDFMTSEKVRWHFIPPRAPHMGGIWEAAIKSAKFHLKRTAGEASLRYDELSTLLTQIEAILNSRPLTPLSNDPNDLNVLTPAHFLIGCSIMMYPELNVKELPTNRLSRWQRVDQLKQHFWQRWVKEYLHNCQARVKWNTKKNPITVGQMVIVQEENLPPLCWSLARVEEIFPGKDNIIRVVSVRTSKGVYKRPITRLCVLPIEEEAGSLQT